MKLRIPFFLDPKMAAESKEKAGLFSILLDKEVTQYLTKQKELHTRSIIIGIIFLVVSIVLFFVDIFLGILGFCAMVFYAFIAIHNYKKLTIDKEISEIGKFYWKMTFLPYENGSIVLDNSLITPKIEFEYNYIEPEQMKEIASLKKDISTLFLKNNLFLSPEDKLEIEKDFFVYDTEKNILEKSKKAKEIIEQHKKRKEILPFIDPDSNLISSMSGLLAMATEYSDKSDGIPIIEENEDEMITKFQALSGFISEDDKQSVDQELGEWISNTNKFLQHHQKMIDRSLGNDLKNFKKDIVDDIINIGYNYYCPDCNKNFFQMKNNFEDFSFDDNSRMNLLSSEQWECPLCGLKTTKPIIVDKILDEVIHPVVRLLMLENKNERLRIYSDIENKKGDLKISNENNIEQIFQRNRSEIEQIQTDIRKVQSEVNQEHTSMKFIADILESSKKLSDERMRSLRQDINQIKSEALDSADNAIKQFNAAIDLYKERSMRELESNVRLARELEEKRDQQFKTLKETYEQGTDKIVDGLDATRDMLEKMHETQHKGGTPRGKGFAGDKAICPQCKNVLGTGTNYFIPCPRCKYAGAPKFVGPFGI